MPDPIPWRPWSPDAFEKARTHRRPILLAIMPAWAQACRDMDRETYADTRVAARLADGWTCIRVDPLARPDIQARYEAGAWPSTVFLTPQGDIIASATYLDANDMVRVLNHISEWFRGSPAELDAHIRDREARIRQVHGVSYPPAESVGAAVLQNTLRGILASADWAQGGFGTQAKYPFASSLMALVTAYADVGGPDFEAILRRTTEGILRGLFDSRRGGFFRLCARPNWTVPHTEKVLEENASLSLALLAIADVLGRRDARAAVDATVRWARALRDGSTGLYAAAQAADPEYYAEDAQPDAPPPEIIRAYLTTSNAQWARLLVRLPDTAEEGVALADALVARVWDERRGVAAVAAPEPAEWGLLRPHALLAECLMDVWTVDPHPRRLETVRVLLERAHDLFWHDGERALVDRLPGEGETAALRIPLRDDESNARIARSWLRHAWAAGDAHSLERAHAVLLSFPNYGADSGHHCAEFAIATDMWVRGPNGVPWPPAAQAPRERAAVWSPFRPRMHPVSAR